MKAGSSTSARAIAMRCRWPPENSCGKRCIAAVRKLDVRQRYTNHGLPGIAAASGADPVHDQSLLNDLPHREPWVERGPYGSWNTTCIRGRRRPHLSAAEPLDPGRPRRLISPAIDMPQAQHARAPSVDLPEPLSPTTPNVSPRRSNRLTPSTARRSLRCRPSAVSATRRPGRPAAAARPCGTGCRPAARGSAASSRRV